VKSYVHSCLHQSGFSQLICCYTASCLWYDDVADVRALCDVIAAISPCVSDDASRVSNLQRVITFCTHHLSSSVCHLSLSDLLYCTVELQRNIVTFVVDLFDSLETMCSATGGSGLSGGCSESLMSG